VGYLPTLEHLAIGADLYRVDVWYGVGIRMAGLTYNRRTYVGDGQNEREPGGLSELGVAVVHRMNDLGMIVDVSHSAARTVIDAVQYSKVPIVLSHNAAYTLRPTIRSRLDEELHAVAARGGLIGVSAVPNALSDDPRQDINCVLDHFDYLVKLVGVDHVAIGSDTLCGDHVGLHRAMLGSAVAHMRFAAPYLDGLESPADGKNLIRGLLARGYSDPDIEKIAGANALALFRRVIG
jgi:membrane dipeptidase